MYRPLLKTFNRCLLKSVSASVGFCSKPNIASPLQKFQNKMTDFILPNDTPVICLDCKNAFDALTEKEKLYAHHLSRASWYGGIIVLVQTSLESPLIYSLLSKVFHAETVAELKEKAVSQCGFEEDDFLALMVYISGILGNMGNYKGFGDLKFIPNLSKEKFVKLVLASKAAASQPDKVQNLLNNCLEQIFSDQDSEKQLGFADVGKTTYFSKNCTSKDSDIVTEFMKVQDFEAWNTRCFKTEDSSGSSCYEIRLASVLTDDDNEDYDLMRKHTINGHKFAIKRGDYGKLLNLANESLLKAKEYAANDNQTQMIEKYIHSFRTGSLNAHKDGSRYWIKDKGPVIETYIGFIESYRDPAGMRGEFEGLVAMVNKPMSEKFTELVRKAQTFLPLLPWPSTYEKDTFLRPDFTSLDVLTFAGSGVPAGICIPNYDDIRQNVGFKNVSLGNILPASFKGRSPNYLNEADKELLLKHHIPSFELQVGLHELLGHGSGKLFTKEATGACNFDVNKVVDLETKEKVSSWYNEGETFGSVFSTLNSSYEECRAECVGLYLSDVPEIHRIFSFEGTLAEEIMYVNWLCMGLAGLEGLQMYEPKTESWLQAHSQARHVILNVFLEAGENFVNIEEITGTDGKPDLLYTMDRSKILSVGKPAIGKFLQRLQLYKATANVSKAKEMYDKYSAVTAEGRYPFLKYRSIVMARKKPRKLFIQSNTVIEDGKVVLKEYESNHEGMVQSWMERFEDGELDDILGELWQKDKPHMS